MRVRILSVFPTVALVLMSLAPAKQMRADVIFSNFGTNQTYEGASWWEVGGVPGTQIGRASCRERV